MGRGDLSDRQWAALEPLLPIAVVGRPLLGRRKLIDAIRWRVRTGVPWRDLPSEYGPWLAMDTRRGSSCSPVREGPGQREGFELARW
ncbi:transposase [Streptomyces sp. NPDC096033]|uniref:transposase n=1 Tax=Streptomyces sp. NPDC096033 TaxID=3366071 RepID=UPI003828D551